MNPKLDALLYRFSVQADLATRWQRRAGRLVQGGFWGTLAVSGGIAVLQALGSTPPAAPAAALLAIGPVLGICGGAVECVALRRRQRFEARAGAAVERAWRRALNRAVRGLWQGPEEGHGRYLH